MALSQLNAGGHDSVTASQHAQYQGVETEAAKWNSAVIHFNC